jgi:hypothetical protein
LQRDLDHGVSDSSGLSAGINTTAPEERAYEDFRYHAERSHMAETVREAHDRFPRFSLEMCAAMIHAPGLLRIGGAAYFV